MLLIDRRPHIAGNAFDCLNEEGLLIHKYGPHIFHTNSEAIFEFLSEFTAWRPYEHRVLARVDGKLLPKIPINLDTINRLYGLEFESAELERWFARARGENRQDRDVRGRRGLEGGSRAVREVLQALHAKAMGARPQRVDKSVTGRVPTRTNRDDRYFGDKHQAMPAAGYTRMFERMLDHPKIEVRLNLDYQEARQRFSFQRLVLHRPDRRVFRLSLRTSALSLPALRT